jgi:hypothetical protein
MQPVESLGIYLLSLTIIFYLKVGATRVASACAARAIPSFDIRYFTLYHLTSIRDKQVKEIVLLPDYLI